MHTTDEKEPFWMHIPLDQMTLSQWASLCDGCGKCCLLKIQEAETQQVRTTKIYCRLLSTSTCQCSNYLPDWHPLITKDPRFTVTSGHSVKSFVVHPAWVNKPIITYFLAV